MRILAVAAAVLDGGAIASDPISLRVLAYWLVGVGLLTVLVGVGFGLAAWRKARGRYQPDVGRQ
jgi:hypothetical protein